MAVLDALWLPIMGLYGVVLLFFLCIGFNLLYLVFVAATRPPRHKDPGPPADFPFVTVQLPIYNELYVVERLIRAACELDWPRDRLQIQVLDDSTDETQFVTSRLVREFRNSGLNIEHVRRDDRVGFKAGALDVGLQSAQGEFIAIFDADFIPPGQFLQRTIPYFSYERVGFVQARWGHLNSSYSVLTEVQSVIIDAHFLVDQVARNRGGYFMNFNGTAGVWRREAIGDAGGWQHDTLAEDLDLSYRAQLRGWEAVYLPDLVAYAELPVTVSAYRCQQRRWATGSFACALKLLPTVMRSKLSLGVKLQATLHLFGYVSHLCLLLMFLLQPFLLYYSQRLPVAPTAPSVSPLWLIVSAIPAMAPGIYLLVAQARATGRPWKRIPYILGASVLGAGIMITVVGAMARALDGRRPAFERTPKYGIARASDSWEGKRYAVGVDSVLAIEILLATFTTATLSYAAMLKNWGSFFYCGYFLVGLFMIIYLSFMQMSAPALPRALASSPSGNNEP